MKTKIFLITIATLALALSTEAAQLTFFKKAHKSQFRYGRPRWQEKAGKFRYDKYDEKENHRYKGSSLKAKYHRTRSRYTKHREGCICGTCKRIRTKKHSSFNKVEHRYQRGCPCGVCKRIRERKRRGFDSARPHRRRTKVIVVQPAYRYYTATVNDYGNRDYYRWYEASSEIILKYDVAPIPIVKAINTSVTLNRKIAFIIENQIAETIFADSGSDFEESFDYRKSARKLIITAMPESIARLATILYDYNTYRSYVALYDSSSRLQVGVFSLVDPQLKKSDPTEAERIARENFGSLKELLDTSNQRWWSGRDKRCWYNSKYGTATIVDEPEMIEKAREFLRHQPYSAMNAVLPG